MRRAALSGPPGGAESPALLLYDLLRILVGTHAEQTRVPQFAMHGPLDEPYLNDDLRTHPVSLAGKTFRLRERRLVDGDCVEPFSQVEQELRVEAGADLSGENEVVAIVLRLTLRTPRALSRGVVADQ